MDADVWYRLGFLNGASVTLGAVAVACASVSLALRLLRRKR